MGNVPYDTSQLEFPISIDCTDTGRIMFPGSNDTAIVPGLCVGWTRGIIRGKDPSAVNTQQEYQGNCLLWLLPIMK